MSENATAVAEVRERKHRGFLADLFLRLVREKPLGTVGGIIVLVLLLTGIFANVLAPYDPIANDMNVRFLPPSGSHILGTDNLGRDLLSRIIFGARISVIVGLAVATIEVFIATAVGIVSGFFGGKTDTIIQRFVDAWMCFPGLVILLTILAVLGQGIGQVIIVLGVVLGIGGSRVMRSAVISIRENVYVEAARAIGSTPARTLLHHILPNIVAPMIIIFTLAVGTAIL
ncbi:MAG: ABC transporter permease, partial [Chloroflexi bacterium]|nr:ABC transporter permease [Chloroflexota bacterium]